MSEHGRPQRGQRTVSPDLLAASGVANVIVTSYRHWRYAITHSPSFGREERSSKSVSRSLAMRSDAHALACLFRRWFALEISSIHSCGAGTQAKSLSKDGILRYVITTAGCLCAYSPPVTSSVRPVHWSASGFSTRFRSRAIDRTCTIPIMESSLTRIQSESSGAEWVVLARKACILVGLT
jgi:hypothetical protein